MSEELNLSKKMYEKKDFFDELSKGDSIINQLTIKYSRELRIDERPNRCRSIIFNPSLDKIIGIERKRPNKEKYTVYPGGGLEDYDRNAKNGAYRELYEELGLSDDQVYLSNKIIELDGEFFFIGIADEEFEDLSIGGPEAERDTNESGTYNPKWISIESLETANMFPQEITSVISLSMEQIKNGE